MVEDNTLESDPAKMTDLEPSSDGNQSSNENGEQIEDGQQAHQPSRLESVVSFAKTFIIRGLIMYFVMSFFRRPAPAQDPTAVSSTPRTEALNLYEMGALMDLYVYVSEDDIFTDFNNSESLIWTQNNLVYGDWTAGPMGDGTYTHRTTIKASERLQNNGTIFLHVYMTKRGKSPDPTTGKTHYSAKHVSYSRRMLNKFKKQRYTKTHNLLTGETAASEEEVKKAETLKEEIVSHWHPNLTINIVADQTRWVYGSVPPPLDEYIEFTSDGRYYKPVVYLNDYWNMLRDYYPINETTKELELMLIFQPLSLFRWQLYTAQAMRNKWTVNVLGDTFTEEEDEDQDTLKEALLETSPYLLGLTIVVSTLHSIFELLAFKNDIQFWNNRRSLEGLSVRSVFFNVFQSLVVLLYVLDNPANTIVKISCFVGLGIEVWKINKVMDIKINREDRILGFLPRIYFTDKGSYVKSSTREYDMIAFKYLSWALFPLLGGYAVYSLLYLEHKGWYSWVLSMLYGFLLTFGFIMMTPQLFINYKMKSVAHLPWRMMTYKFFNTFIDDIFAFVIKMPTMYRLGCFRDDIVFFIFLYQRWIYKTDPSRINEFGFSAEMEEAAAAKSNQVNGTPAIDAAPPPSTSKSPSRKKKD
ncbi:cleft lip and palate transmembrane protein 1 homolog [Ischnura elegans]|uniref:cleft lip and palate transmembrane protein 1 homolog n=1 Tax=Ischnura elegans TaxID=197161 RepID=UPI001ED8B940|nr:cleft lip and palate transmembrane protein 1 homolog [Ischnura elegans]